MIFTFQNSGTYYQNYEDKTYRMDRKTSRGDRYCMGTNPFTSVPCRHQVQDGIRYLYFDQDSQPTCCNCCSNVHGCGVMRPTWADAADQESTETLDDGEVVDKFVIQGLQTNQQQVTKTGVPQRINMLPNDDIVFDTNSQVEKKEWADVFTLPQECSNAGMCQGICTAVRQNNANESQCKAHQCGGP